MNATKITSTIPWNYIELNDYFSMWLKNDGKKVHNRPITISEPIDKILYDVWRWIFKSSFIKHASEIRTWYRMSKDVCQQKCKEFIDYHIYMAWLSIRLLLSNGFRKVTMQEVSMMYAENYKTVSKAFDRKPEQDDNGHDLVRYQLCKIMGTANMFQKKWSCWTGIKPHILPSIVIGEEDERVEDCWLDDNDSEYVNVDDYVEDDNDYFDDNMRVKIKKPKINIVDWDTDKIFRFIKNRIYDYDDKEFKLTEPVRYANVKNDPVNGMIYDISCWLVKKGYEKYHVFRISYVAEKLMSCAFRCVTKREIEYDFKYFPEFMEKCFRNWSDDRESINKCINKMYMTIVQFQHKWRCLKNNMPLKINGLTEEDDLDNENDDFYEYKMWLNDSDCDLTWSDVEEQAKKCEEQEKEPTVQELYNERQLDISNIEYEIRRHNDNIMPSCKNLTRRQTIFNDEI